MMARRQYLMSDVANRTKGGDGVYSPEVGACVGRGA